MNETQMVTRGQQISDGFDQRQLSRSAETGVAASQAQATAAVQARYIMAARFPRNMQIVEEELTRECQRPGFALTARYSRPVGGEHNASGWSIRFAERALSSLNHIDAWATPTYDDAEVRVLKIGVTDFQRNVSYSREFTIAKTVERSNPKGREVISERINSWGKPVYIVTATDEELAVKESIATSKFWRNAIRFIPGDILERCEAEVEKTIAAMPPEAKITHMVKEFAKLRVQSVDIQQFLGHTLQKKAGDGKMKFAVSEAEIEELRSAYSDLKNGVRTWSQIIEEKQPDGSAEESARIAAEKIEELRSEKADQSPPRDPPADALVEPTPEMPSDEEEIKRFDQQEAAKQQKRGGKFSL